MKLRPTPTQLRQIRSVRGPVILFVIAIVLVVALLVLWNVGLAVSYQRIRELTRSDAESGAFHWTFIAVGSALLIVTITLLSVIGGQLIAEIRQSQRTASFIATFTHELNSPLASIKLFAQTLKRPGLKPDEQERFLDLILGDVERLRSQIGNVLRAAQIDGPFGLKTNLEETELHAYLDDHLAARRLGLERMQSGVRLELAPSEPVWVRLDRSLFRQALDNLLDNAVKYARPDAGGVHIRVVLLPGAQTDTVAVEVRDDGCGIHPHDLEQIFQRFKRADHGPPARCQGTGLGLWVVRTIVEAHDGEVWASSPGPGQGTTVRVELPRLLPEEESPSPDRDEPTLAGPDPVAAPAGASP